MCDTLDKESPDTGDHKAYTAFRYLSPTVPEAVDAALEDGGGTNLSFLIVSIVELYNQ